MANLELKRMQDARGERDGAIVWALTLHGDELQRKLRAVYRLDSDDLYQEIVTTLYTTPYDKTKEWIESGDFKRIWGWFDLLAKRQLSANHSRSRQENFEREITATEDEQLTDYLTATSESEPLAAMVDPCTITALKMIDDPKYVQALALSSFGYNWTEIATITGYSSKQAAQRAFTSPSREAKLRLAWRGLHGDEICPEIAEDLSTVAWTLTDLDAETKARVDAHLSMCPSCAQILDTHEATRARAAAFFPLPALLTAPQAETIGSHIHAAVDWIGAKFHNAFLTVTGQSANGSWTAPKTAAVVVAGAIAATGGGAAVHKATSNSDSESTKPAAATTYTRTTFYDPIDVPSVNRKKKPVKKKKKKHATQVAPAPAPIQAPQSTQQSNSSPSSVGDGSSEFLPEER